MEARNVLVAWSLLALPGLAAGPSKAGASPPLPVEAQVAISGYLACGLFYAEKFAADPDAEPAPVLRRTLDECGSFRRDLLAFFEKNHMDADLTDAVVKPVDAAFERAVAKSMAEERARRSKTKR
jgi:hypothetical protein